MAGRAVAVQRIAWWLSVWVVKCLRGFRVRPVPSELWRGRLSRFSVLLGGWVFYVWEGEGCRLLVCCVVVSLVRAEVSVPSVATSGCPKRSEGGCPCRSEDVHRPSSQQCGRLKAYESPPPSQDSSGQSTQKVFSYRTGQIRVTNSRKSSTSLPCSNKPVPKRVATSALSSNDK